jgi:hypothetical protein
LLEALSRAAAGTSDRADTYTAHAFFGAVVEQGYGSE